ncbi:YtxH domain-containing protein [Peribacillus sp. SI8-4]|uniref:YtxH domain-containing protein n=1 Tax=Peribacillus sp. SI8-4 TaxID=3048009 RepID=UPI0025569C37|nr:YtxH domain-containing protein [Peribacillus sp. SI8-4]
MTQSTTETQSNSKLLKGILIGGLVGGALTLLDSTTRNKVKRSAVLLKDNSANMIEKVKENPGEVKEQMISGVKGATETIKEAISDVETLYETVNEDVVGKVSEVKDISTDALGTAKEATSELKDISSKVVVAGKQLKETPSQSLKSNKKGEKESDEIVTKSELSNQKSISSNF